MALVIMALRVRVFHGQLHSVFACPIFMRLLSLRRTETVQTNGIIGPRRVAEIGLATNKNLRLHRLPVDEICTRLHDDGQIAAASDIESKSIRSHAEARVARLWLRIP